MTCILIGCPTSQYTTILRARLLSPSHYIKKQGGGLGESASNRPGLSYEIFSDLCSKYVPWVQWSNFIFNVFLISLSASCGLRLGEIEIWVNRGSDSSLCYGLSRTGGWSSQQAEKKRFLGYSYFQLFCSFLSLYFFLVTHYNPRTRMCPCTTHSKTETGWSNRGGACCCAGEMYTCQAAHRIFFNLTGICSLPGNCSGFLTHNTCSQTQITTKLKTKGKLHLNLITLTSWEFKQTIKTLSVLT